MSATFAPSAPAAALRPGLLVLHGNRLELLAEAVFDWLRNNPLGPLEAESVLVQSNGMAEWVKMELARAHGICAATRVELPARFIWRAYRAVLGRGAVPGISALDKQPLTWRLMQLLPQCAGEPGFEPVAGFLRAGGDSQAAGSARRFQLAQRLADLFDQYQVYRSDWLSDWAQGRDVMRRLAGESTGSGGGGGSGLPRTAVPPEQAWQPALWRAVLQTLPLAEQQGARAALHQRFLQALQAGGDFPALPRRIVLFGTTHLPHQTLEAVAALATHCQVLMAVPNPCRYHWADIIEGRELLRAQRRRHSPRAGMELAHVPLQDMHLHGHPLLAAWGRQGRDFVRQLDVFDDVQAARQRFAIPKVDLFDSEPTQGGDPSLLTQVQAAICNLLPLAEHPRVTLAETDRSVVFHIAHSAQREVEILHDQLLHWLAHTPGASPRDVVVMVPDVNRFAPAIRSVFGQFSRGHARHIPWGITDQTARGQQPLLVALEWLLRAPQQRFAASELRDLLDVPAVASRFGVSETDLPTLLQWIEGAGIRWGLHATQRASLGLGAAGEANTWAFGLRRMLLGYATGATGVTGVAGHTESLPSAPAGGFQGTEPYTEVAGLEAALAGTLAELLHALDAWWRQVQTPCTPTVWAQHLRGLLLRFFKATDDSERAQLAALDDALSSWLQACEAADFDDAVDLAVLREAWLEGLEAPSLNQRFKAGGVTFCTLLPLRAIPFKVVCLVGMNEGDYPRRSARSDFDLMAQPGQARPGDRSRRDDDRQLMLDALLSARQVLYLSWVGRSVRDNGSQPPSVLVSQLQDYLKAGWGEAVLLPRTTEHPMQAFSRKYFERAAPGAQALGAGAGLFTYANEWRAAHNESANEQTPILTSAAFETAPANHANPSGEHHAGGETSPRRVTLAELQSFLRNPVKSFFAQRLQVHFSDAQDAVVDEEAFTLAGLERWQSLHTVLQAVQAQGADTALFTLSSAVARLQRAGQLPLAGPGERLAQAWQQALEPAVLRWQEALHEWPQSMPPLSLQWPYPGAAQGLAPTPADAVDPMALNKDVSWGASNSDWHLDDALVGLRSGGPQGGLMWVELQASKVLSAPKTASPRAMLLPWLRCLASAACGQPAHGWVVGVDAAVRVSPPADAALAREELSALLQAMQQGLSGAEPWPTALLTGVMHLTQPDKAAAVFDGSGVSGSAGAARAGALAEGQEPCLARLFPDFEALSQQPRFEEATQWLYHPFTQWLATHTQVEVLEAASATSAAAPGANHA